MRLTEEAWLLLLLLGAGWWRQVTSWCWGWPSPTTRRPRSEQLACLLNGESCKNADGFCCVGVYGGLVGSSLLLRTLDQLPAILIDKGFEVLLFTPSQDDDVRAHHPPPPSATTPER